MAPLVPTEPPHARASFASRGICDGGDINYSLPENTGPNSVTNTSKRLLALEQVLKCQCLGRRRLPCCAGNETQTMVGKAPAPLSTPCIRTNSWHLGTSGCHPYGLVGTWVDLHLCARVQSAVHRRADLPETNEATDSGRCHAPHTRSRHAPIPSSRGIGHPAQPGMQPRRGEGCMNEKDEQPKLGYQGHDGLRTRRLVKQRSSEIRTGGAGLSQTEVHVKNLQESFLMQQNTLVMYSIV